MPLNFSFVYCHELLSYGLQIYSKRSIIYNGAFYDDTRADDVEMI